MSARLPLPVDGRDAAVVAAIELRGISKRFGAVQANWNIDLTVRQGEIHGIVGENGAGKSTLMSILYGLYQPDEGEILVHGKPVRMSSSHDAITAGIGMVHQHFMLVEPFSVVENVMLGAEGGRLLAPSRRKVRTELERLEAEYRLEVPAEEPIRHLPVGVQQRVEILKALFRKADILILDEPTGVLTPAEADHLFRILAALRAQGKTVILITHKLREILAITDTVSVMRQGGMVATFPTAETSKEQLAELMVGRKVAKISRRASRVLGEVILRADHLELADGKGVRHLKDVSLTLRRGEILGVAGVSGNGQTELLAVLSGMQSATRGAIRIGSTDIATLRGVNARTFRDLGVGHIPEDRQRDGLVVQFNASECSILGGHDDRSFNGPMTTNWSVVIQQAQDLMNTFDVRPPDPLLKVANLSGGNQQKLVVGREVARDPDILLVGQPTRGVDIGAIESIHAKLLDLRDAGKAILLVSVELDEILALSDRIVVMFDGEIVGEVASEDADDRHLGLMMAGVRPQQ